MVTSSNPDQRPKAAPPGASDDAFLGGRVHILQPRQGFRAGLDAVMLAAAVRARGGDRVCDLGAGVGTVALCLAVRAPGLHITAVEIDEDLAALARMNAARNTRAASLEVIVADVLKRPRTLARQSFDHVFTNPPFHDIGRGTRARAHEKARATSAHAKELVDWLRFARALAKPKGTVSAILPLEQLATALNALSPQGFGAELLPLWPKQGEAAKRFIIRVRINSRTRLTMHAGLMLHRADGKPTAEADAVLRDAAALTT